MIDPVLSYIRSCPLQSVMVEPVGPPLDISEVSETLLIPLFSRAIESRSKNPIIIDEKAVEITQVLNESFKGSDSALHRRLSKGRLRRRSGKQLGVALCLRTRKFDRYCQDFLRRNPGGTVVEMGCGLSTRYARMNDRNVLWYDLDLPEVVRIRRRFFDETDNYVLIESSVLDLNWTSSIAGMVPSSSSPKAC